MSKLRPLLLLGLSAASVATAQVPPPASPRSTGPHLILVGDSTVAASSGWGPAFQEFLIGATSANTARGGRSSKSFRDEGLWGKALALQGDYYLIQFGHNDQPGKGPERETDPATTYAANLTRYVDEVRQIGATPVLITSLTRRNFSATALGRIESTLTPYAEAMKRVAAEKNVPLVDLHARSIELCERLGPVETARFNPVKPDGSPDTTHLGPAGAFVFAQLVAEELARAVPALAPCLRAPAPPTPPSVPGARFLPDLVYAQAAGESLLLDASVPAGPGPHPVILLIHGGGWTRGSKAGDTAPLLEPLTRAGFTCFAINYRLAPAHRWPACLDDVVAAIRWAKAHAAEYQGDPTRLALVGYSAGGQLATFAATVVDDSARVQAVVALSPPTDFIQELPQRGHQLGRAQQALLDRPSTLTPETRGLLRALSPVNHLRPGLPPFLLIHGDADRTVPLEQSVAFQARVRADGGRCDLLVLPGAPHRLADWSQHLPDWQTQLTAWLHATLAPAPSP